MLAIILTAALTLHPELFYQDDFCKPEISITNTTHNQYRLSDGKVADCITVYGVAFEIDFARKAWAEGIGQALHYAKQAERELSRRFVPGVVVIVEAKDDCKNLKILYDQNVDIAIVEIGEYAYRCE